MIGLNIQTSFLTPPFGFALFYLRGVASAAVKTLEMYRGVIAFIGLQLLALVIVAYYPKLVNYLPNRIALTSETAPPPLNPRLQFCLEKNLFAEYQGQQPLLLAAVNDVRQLDLGLLPKKLEKATATALDNAEQTFPLLSDIEKAGAAVQIAAVDYRPLHREVRSIQRRIKRLETNIKHEQSRLDRLANDAESDASVRQAMSDQIASWQSEKKTLLTTIPPSWDQAHDEFQQLQLAHQKLRQSYRRNVDGAYIPIRDLIAVISDTDKLAALESRLQQLRESVAVAEPADSVEPVAEVLTAVRGVAGTDAIKSALTKARRDLKKKKPRKEKALKSLDKAIKLYTKELAWRQQAKTTLLSGLTTYEGKIRHNIGLRQQEALPKEKALELVSCTAAHRDISLHF